MVSLTEIPTRCAMSAVWVHTASNVTVPLLDKLDQPYLHKKTPAM
jgi:hypothetical protein